jgi:hypothetical protein
MITDAPGLRCSLRAGRPEDLTSVTAAAAAVVDLRGGTCGGEQV